MLLNSLVVLATPAVAGFASWFVSSRIEPRWTWKLVKQSPSGLDDLDDVRLRLANVLDRAGVELQMPDFEEMAATVMSAPPSELREALQEAGRLVRAW